MPYTDKRDGGTQVLARTGHGSRAWRGVREKSKGRKHWEHARIRVKEESKDEGRVTKQSP